jgi:hypothetical protein
MPSVAIIINYIASIPSPRLSGLHKPGPRNSIPILPCPASQVGATSPELTCHDLLSTQPAVLLAGKVERANGLCIAERWSHQEKTSTFSTFSGLAAGLALRLALALRPVPWKPRISHRYHHTLPSQEYPRRTKPDWCFLFQLTSCCMYSDHHDAEGQSRPPVTLKAIGFTHPPPGR